MSARKLPSAPDSGTCLTIAGAAPPAGVADVVDSVVLPTIDLLQMLGYCSQPTLLGRCP